MFRTKTLLGVLFVVCAASISSAANIIYVDVNGLNDPGTGSYEDPFRRIQDAIDAAIGGDIIEIQPGLYSGPGNYDLDPNGLSITIRSTDPNDPNVIANTIIDPNGAGRGFYFHSGEDANCVVSGLAIRNAYTGGKGAGIYCYNSSPTIINCVISGNSAGTHGGGIFCQNSDSVIIRCVINDNSSANDGGGLECWHGKPEVTNCIISNNQALNGNGGGVDCFNEGNSILTNCTLVKNSAAGYGGALYCLGSDVTIKNNSILWANEAAQGPEIALEPYFGITSNVSVSYSDVQWGETVVYDPCTGLVWSGGNMDADPCFASFDPNKTHDTWDFHLQSVYGRWDPNSQEWVVDSNTSPCIDAGDPNSDWSDEPWPNGKRINMGAYGGTNQASMNGNPADFDIDGAVNFVDFAEFSNKWFAKVPCIEDLNDNEVVDFADLRIFAENWLWQRE